ncbi:hypothetical protein ACSQ9Q_25735, partial [Salmonella enterica]
PPVEAGTHRNDSGDSLNVAGIHVIQGVEDVKGCKVTAPDGAAVCPPAATSAACSPQPDFPGAGCVNV